MVLNKNDESQGGLEMKLEQIIRQYGKTADYYDMNTGYTYHIPQMSEPDENGDQTIPVSEDGKLIGTCKVNLTRRSF